MNRRDFFRGLLAAFFPLVLLHGREPRPATGGVIFPRKKMTDEELAEFRRAWNDQFRGKIHHVRILIDGRQIMRAVVEELRKGEDFWRLKP